jgi:hypothetical protein
MLLHEVFPLILYLLLLSPSLSALVSIMRCNVYLLFVLITARVSVSSNTAFSSCSIRLQVMPL